MRNHCASSKAPQEEPGQSQLTRQEQINVAHMYQDARMVGAKV